MIIHKKVIMLLFICSLVIGCTKDTDLTNTADSKINSNQTATDLKSENAIKENIDEQDDAIEVSPATSTAAEGNDENVLDPAQEIGESDDDAIPIAANLKFEYIDTERDARIEKIVNQAYQKLTDDFEMTFDSDITFKIYKDQKEFWERVFGGENNGITTGFANHVENIVHLTSPTDISIKSEADMLKVPVHELVHILLPSNTLDIREGLAYYLADQLKDFSTDDIPTNVVNIITYQGEGDQIRMQYNLAGYKAKFIIEECFDMDYLKYKTYMASPNDYTVLGYEHETDFSNALTAYLQSLAK
ncbi:hypothetical protein KHM83_08880 [Fusibacter paucivorans]|uniref:Peptidase MA superfamily protein n=1 Tax=Fusibacter paucivorans TaxID=76009 RepID=A0ABS5PNP6_9FIRM|nr:hypothetical protein [Fusibacter paucivorans]MBS7526790.1 hypothetical protein [Fusibacter paucivorans]